MRHLFAALAVALTATSANALPTCADLPDHAQLKAAIKDATAQKNGGMGLPMWAATVDRSGVVCAVAYSGDTVDAQWPGSRVIAAQKANTANGFSLKNLALATANLYSITQPGGFAFGLQESNPVNPAVAYAGSGTDFGTASDPMVGGRIGGLNVFGGGLALYNASGDIIGGMGVSGDTSCADHNIAWRARHALKLDYVPGGVAKDKTDQIIYDIAGGKSASGFGHPTCVNGTEPKVAKTLPPVARVKK